MTKAKASTALAKQPQKAVAVPDSSLDDYAAHASGGLEQVTSSDLLIPRLVIIQSTSDEIKKSKPKFIAGAEVGDIADVGTKQVFKDEVLFLPVYYSKVWIEWAPRGSTQSLIAVHDNSAIMEQTKKSERNENLLPNGNRVSETAQFFGLNLNAGRRPTFLPMASTQLKKAKYWCTLASNERITREDGTEFTPPLWSRVYRLGVADESNAQGDWKGWTVTPDLQSHEAAKKYSKVEWPKLRQEILGFLKSLQTGAAKADLAAMQADQPDPEVM